MTVIAAFGLTACVHQPHGGPVAKLESVGLKQELKKRTEKTTARGVSKEVLKQLLLARFAYSKRDWDLSASSVVEATRLSHDWRAYEKPAQIALALKDYARAVQLSSSWLENDADSDLASLIFVASQIGLGEVALAMPVAQHFLNRNSDSGFDTLGHYLRAQSNAAAVTLMQELYPENAGSANFLFQAALIAVWFRQSDLSTTWLDESLQLEDDFEPALLLRYELLKAGDSLPVALAYLYKASLQFKDAYIVRDKLVAELYEQGQFSLVVEYANKVDLKDPKHVELLSYLAQSHIQLQDEETAKTVLMDLLKIAPDHDRAKFRLGFLYFYESDYAAAIQWFSKVGSKESALSFEANMKIAQALARQEKGELGMKRALRQLNAVNTLTRDQFIRHAEVRDDVLLENKQYLRAFAFVNEALIEYPEDTELLYRRAMSASFINEITIAESDLRKILLERPNDADILNTLGYILVDNTQRYAEAKPYIEKALALQPNSYYILDSMGWVLFKLGDFKAAQSYLERAYAIEKNPEVAAHLSEVMFVRGETTAAKALLRKTMEQHADDKVVVSTIERLGLIGL